MDEKLKPCPFCGRNDGVVVDKRPLSRLWSVYCENCEIAGPFGTNEATASEAWNTRPSAEPGEGEVSDKRHAALYPNEPPPALVCAVESYWDAHETARDLGYPSITEALEALSPRPPMGEEGVDLDGLALLMLNRLHEHLPEDERPMALMDMSDEQARRAKAAVLAVLLAAPSAALSEPAGRFENIDATLSLPREGGERGEMECPVCGGPSMFTDTLIGRGALCSAQCANELEAKKRGTGDTP